MTRSNPEKLMEELKPAAKRACENAYVPYSRFPVGAAVTTDGGDVYPGCNVENASFGLTICAERNALAQAVVNGVGPGRIRGVVIYTPGEVVHPPCGACRQVMHELLDKDAVVVSCCDGEETSAWGMHDLIPDPFQF